MFFIWVSVRNVNRTGKKGLCPQAIIQCNNFFSLHHGCMNGRPSRNNGKNGLNKNFFNYACRCFESSFSHNQIIVAGHVFCYAFSIFHWKERTVLVMYKQNNYYYKFVLFLCLFIFFHIQGEHTKYIEGKRID